MRCISDFKDATYGRGLFCRVCGMDIGMDPVKIRHGGAVMMYCCVDCAKVKDER